MPSRRSRWNTSLRHDRLPCDWQRIRAVVKARAGGRCQAERHARGCNGNRHGRLLASSGSLGALLQAGDYQVRGPAVRGGQEPVTGSKGAGAADPLQEVLDELGRGQRHRDGEQRDPWPVCMIRHPAKSTPTGTVLFWISRCLQASGSRSGYQQRLSTCMQGDVDMWRSTSSLTAGGGANYVITTLMPF